MDCASHAFIGAGVGELGRRHWSRRQVVGWCAFFGILPDVLSNWFLYPYLGWLKGRDWLIPRNEDWIGFRESNPWLSATWEATHSLVFVAVVILPVVRYFRLPRACSLAYLSHVLADIVTHSGEWSATPLWPLPWRVEGWADAWRWDSPALLLSVLASAAFWLGCRGWASVAPVHRMLGGWRRWMGR
ncbi:MAG: metal-dependent hydrolase [Acidobacteriota bacterium]